STVRLTHSSKRLHSHVGGVSALACQACIRVSVLLAEEFFLRFFDAVLEVSPKRHCNAVRCRAMSMSQLMSKPSPSSPILVDPREAARLLSISPRKLWQLTKDGEIPSLKIGKSVRYRVADLDSWTQKQLKASARDAAGAKEN